MFGVAQALLPLHYGVADVAWAIGGQIASPCLLAQTDDSAELTTPDPASKAGQPRDKSSIGQFDEMAVGLRFVHLVDECERCSLDSVQFFLCDLRAQVA